MKIKTNVAVKRAMALLRKQVAVRDDPERGRKAYATDQLRSWLHEGLYDLPHDGPLLALGCEQAFLAPHLGEYSSDVTVLDSSTDQVAQLARRFPEIAFLPHNPANPLPFPHDTFAAIWCCEFLDRVFDPAAALSEIHRVLVPGGRLLVTVPDHGRMRNVLSSLLPRAERFAPATPRVRHFTRASLAIVARDADFGEITVKKGRPIGRSGDEGACGSLLLRARKGPGVRAAMATARPTTRRNDETFAEELAYASRTRAA